MFLFCLLPLFALSVVRVACFLFLSLQLHLFVDPLMGMVLLCESFFCLIFYPLLVLLFSVHVSSVRFLSCHLLLLSFVFPKMLWLSMSLINPAIVILSFVFAAYFCSF